MLLANRIRNIREACNLTQSEMASICNISPSAYGQIERKASKCNLETLQKIACALNVSLPFLIDIENCSLQEVKNKL